MVEFDKNGAIKTKKYSIDYILGNNKSQSIIIIIYNKCISSINNRV